MSAIPPDLDELITRMARLPGLGQRSARRAVLHLIAKRETHMHPLGSLMTRVAAQVRACSVCGNIATDELCEICANPVRANGQICVVEAVSDLWALERGGAFRGRYHVLGGTLSVLDDIGPEKLNIPALVSRVAAEQITEVILALNATVEGQTTAHYIADALANSGAKVTSLAQGVPIGGELDYLDEGTISAALSARKTL